jgi:hypothetical protein
LTLFTQLIPKLSDSFEFLNFIYRKQGKLTICPTVPKFFRIAQSVKNYIAKNIKKPNAKSLIPLIFTKESAREEW